MKIKLSKLFTPNLLILYLVLILGSFLRIQGALTNSFAFTYDVGRDMLALWDIVYSHHPVLIGPTTGIPGVFYGPWWYYMLAPFFFIFQGDPQGIAIIMAVFGVLSIILSYFVGKKISGEFLGLAFAAVVSVSPMMISLSSQIWNPNIAPVPVLFILFLLAEIYTNKKINLVYYFCLGALMSLMLDIELVFGFLFIIGMLIAILIVKRIKLSLKAVILYLMGFILVLLPRIMFDIRHNFLMANSFITYFKNGAEPQSLGFMELVNSRLAVFFGDYTATVGGGNKIIGLIILLYTIIVIVIYFSKAKDLEKTFIKISTTVLSVFILGTIFFSHDIWSHYLVGLPVFYILLFVIATGIIAIKDKRQVPLLIIVIVCLINFNPISFVSNFGKPLWVGDASVYRNQLNVIDYVYKSANGKDFKYVVYTPPVHDYTYQYLFKWYGPKNYKYAPVEKSNLAFFIIEPDLSNPGRVADWLKARVGDGKVVSSKVLKGGITVQTRVNK
ncbi:MAG TPA: glycosyltransferase family 39 protein [Patescibacteria group bacterium]|nr:glycosyltransferase family 39 protein [Patescibacteria group bacterium]